jgi:hypothetical protein
MTKQELLNKVQAKVGFHSFIQDELSPDNIQGDVIEKRYLYINHVNADGTAGKTYIYYMYDTLQGTAWFYNAEAESVDTKEPVTDQKKISSFESYLAGKYTAFFINRMNLINNWIEADVYTNTNGKLTKKTVIAYKNGNNPINDADVI